MAFIAKKLEGDWVTLDCDPATEESEKTWFFIKPLTAAMFNYIFTGVEYKDKSGNTHTKGYEAIFKAVKYGLAKIKGFVDGDGKEVELVLTKGKVLGIEVDCVPDAFLDLLPLDVVGELSVKIQGLATLSKKEKDDLNFTEE